MQMSSNTAENKDPQSFRSMGAFGMAALTLLGASSAWAAQNDSEAPLKLAEMVVTSNGKSGYISRDSSLNKFTQPLLNTPQSVSVVSHELLQDQHATTMKDAVRNVPGISIAAGEGGAQGDSLTLRGFTARNDIFLDGMRDFGSYYRDAFNWEKVEVLKGPSSIAFGRGSTGGVVNQVSKVPELKPEGDLSLTFGSDQRERASLDVNIPLTTWMNGASFRLNAFQEHASVTGRDVVQTKHDGIAPSLSLGLGTDTRVELSYLMEESDDIPDYGIPWLLNGPAAVDRHVYYGFQSDYLRTHADIVTAKIEHDLNEDMTLKDQFRYGAYLRDMRATEPKVAGSPTVSTPLSSIVINRNELNRNSTETYLGNQFDVNASFKTGSVSHVAVVGIEVSKETSNPLQYTITGVPTTNLTAPNNNTPFSGTNTAASYTTVTTDTLGLYALDTLKFDEHWELTGGLRWDSIHTDYSKNGSPLASTDGVLSWRGALVYKPVQEGSVYLSYGTSFNPSSETLSLSAGTVSLAPEENVTYELGTKWDLMDKKVSLRAALFRSEKLNARETDPANANNIVLSGDQRVDGFELEGAGQINEKWNVTFGYAYMKSELVSSTYFPTAVGSPLANVPAHTLSVWSTYKLPWRIEVGGGMNFVDARRASSTVPNDPTTGLPKEIPSYCLFNAMASAQLSDKISTQLNVYNLFDLYYYDQAHPGHIVPGAGRTFVVSVDYTF